jgi:hypothetical protein
MAAQTVPFSFTSLDERTFDLAALSSLTAHELKELPGVGWPTFRQIVLKVQDAGLNLRGYCNPRNSLESLPLGPCGILAYRVMRGSRFNSVALPGKRICSITDLTNVDYVALRRVFQGTFKGEIPRLRGLLAERKLDIAPLRPHRTINDVASHLVGILASCQLPAKTPLTHITQELLFELEESNWSCNQRAIREFRKILIECGHFKPRTQRRRLWGVQV